MQKQRVSQINIFVRTNDNNDKSKIVSKNSKPKLKQKHPIFMVWTPNPGWMMVFGPQLICMWVLAQSYQLGSKLHPVYPLLALMHLPHRVFPPPPLFPVYSLYISPRKMFSNPHPLLTSSPYSLLLVGQLSLPPHFAHILTFIRILRDSHVFRGFLWYLFQSSKSVRQ